MRYVISAMLASRDDDSDRWIVIAEYDSRTRAISVLGDLCDESLIAKLKLTVYPESVQSGT